MSDKKRDSIIDMYPDNEFMFADGFDDAIIGVLERFGSEPIVCYNREMVINKMVEDGMTREESEEYFDYNIIGAYVGETTPAFINTIDSWE